MVLATPLKSYWCLRGCDYEIRDFCRTPYSVAACNARAKSPIVAEPLFLAIGIVMY